MSKVRESRQELMDAIIDLAKRDYPFRKALLDEPRPAVYEHFGIQIPESFRIRFIERDPALDAMVVLPPMIALPPLEDSNTDELTDESLEAVAGGAQNLEGDPEPDPEWPEEW